jgi:hypothetical protein
MRLVLVELRRLGHRIVGYLKDTCGAPASASPMVATSPDDSARAHSEFLELYRRLGLNVHPNKVDFSGSGLLDMLGALVVSEAGLFSLSPAKLAKVRSTCANLLSYTRRNQSLARLRHLRAVAGLLSSLFLSVGQCRLRLRPLRRRHARPPVAVTLGTAVPPGSARPAVVGVARRSSPRSPAAALEFPVSGRHPDYGCLRRGLRRAPLCTSYVVLAAARGIPLLHFSFQMNERFYSSECRDECKRKRKSKAKRSIPGAAKYLAALRHAQGAYLIAR